MPRQSRVLRGARVLRGGGSQLKSQRDTSRGKGPRSPGLAKRSRREAFRHFRPPGAPTGPGTVGNRGHAIVECAVCYTRRASFHASSSSHLLPPHPPNSPHPLLRHRCADGGFSSRPNRPRPNGRRPNGRSPNRSRPNRGRPNSRSPNSRSPNHRSPSSSTPHRSSPK